MALAKISFSPSETVTYMPDNTKQVVMLVITNNGQQAIIFKMKSTRPGRYKMRPVYGKVMPGDHTNVQLIYKGMKPGTSVPMKDHYTCTYTLCTSSTTDVQKMWKNHKHVRELVNQAIKKHKLLILYKGYNDQQVDMSSLQGDLSEQRPQTRVKKGKGLVDEEDDKAGAAVPAARPKDQVQLVFREQACPLSESVSEDEEDEDDEKKPSAEKVNQQPAKSAATGAIQEMTTAPVAKLGDQDKAQPMTDLSKLKTAPVAKLDGKK